MTEWEYSTLLVDTRKENMLVFVCSIIERAARCFSNCQWELNGFVHFPLPLSRSNNPTLEMRDTEAIRNLKSILRGTLRIITHDDRAFVGTFVGTDKSLNILLVNTEEFRLGGRPGENNTAGRYVGQVMVPWHLIRNIALHVGGESNAEAYDAEQVCPIKVLLLVRSSFLRPMMQPYIT